MLPWAAVSRDGHYTYTMNFDSGGQSIAPDGWKVIIFLLFEMKTFLKIKIFI